MPKSIAENPAIFPGVSVKVLSLISARQKAPAIIRVEFSSTPNAKDAKEANGALNPANWTLTGPGAVTVVAVEPVSGYPKRFDVFAAAPLPPGSWTVTASTAIAGPFGRSMRAPFSATFAASKPDGYASFTVTDSPSEADALRSFLSPALPKDGWDPLVQAIGSAAQRNRDDARAGFDQLFPDTARGGFLTRLVAGQGVERPKNAGMSDDAFASLASALQAGKITAEALRAALEPFYGSDACRATVLSAPEPFALSGGEDLRFAFDGLGEVEAEFAAADFDVPGQATAAEVCARLQRAIGEAASKAKATPRTLPSDGLTRVALTSASLGPRSAARVTGGRAQNALGFPEPLALLDGSLPTWNVTPDPADGAVTFSSSGASGLNLLGLRSGDYVNVFGGEFAAVNRGSFAVVSVSVTFPGGVVLQSFVVENRAASSQLGLAQAAEASILYFRPAAARPVGGPSVVPVAGSLKVSLPATAAAVGRGPGKASYLRPAGPAAAATSIRRLASSSVTVNAAAHGLSVGDQVELSGARPSAAAPAKVTGTPPNLDASKVSAWASAPAPILRAFHQAVALADGRILVACGSDGNTGLNTSDCRLLTATGPTALAGGERRWAVSTAAAAALPGGAPPINHRASLLASGKAFLTGGEDAAQANSFNATFLYDPDLDSWSSGPNMTARRARHQQIAMANGKVLIVGGANDAGGSTVSLSSCDLYDPDAGTMVATGSMTDTVRGCRLVSLRDGRVLRIGGRGRVAGAGTTTSLWTCEVYDSGAGTWTRTGPMSCTRQAAMAVLMSDGRVLVGGGVGREASRPETEAGPLATCEVWNPATGRWSPGPAMASPRSGGEFVAVGGRVYAVGSGADPDDATKETLEYLDEGAVSWRRSTAVMAPARSSAGVAAFNAEVVLCSGGVLADSSTPLSDEVLVLASDSLGAGSMNGLQRVASVIDADHFSFQTETGGYWEDLSGFGTVTPAKAPPEVAGLPGAHVYDPDGPSPSITSTGAALTVGVTKGVSYAELGLNDASAFPDEPGWICLAFGRSCQASPVRYLGRASATALILDFAPMPATVPAGARVVLLAGKGSFVPASPQASGGFYLTDAPAARAGAQAVVEASAAAGTEVDVTVTYPGDRGLGNEGLPKEGAAKVSDVVEVWAADVDAEVAAARGAS